MSGSKNGRASWLRTGALLCGSWCLAACSSPRPLTGTSWQLRAFGDTAVTASDFGRAHVVLQDAAVVSGSGFCNPLQGRYQLNARARMLSFSGLQTNWTACPALPLEARLLASLRQVDRYEQRGRHLVLYRGTTPLLTFSGQ